MTTFFNKRLAQSDPDLFSTISGEYKRQKDHVELIASENFTSQAVLDAQGSVLTNKYAEGYPGRRYYGGCAEVDTIEALAIKRACTLFKCDYANVQPHSGSGANQAVFLALLEPGDAVLGMALEAGGHLTHGALVNLSGKWFRCMQYGVSENTGLIDYEDIAQKAQQHNPKLIIAGWSAYSRHLDFKRLRNIADAAGAYLLVDMAHFSGLVAAGLYPSPFPHAHVVTSTTHKTLRGPRGGIILSNEESLFKKLNSSIFPGLQGGPLMHVIAGKAVAFGEACTDTYTTYMQQVVSNAQTLSNTLLECGYDIVTGGTDTHLMMVDLRCKKGLTGNIAEQALEEIAITTNKNTIPFDPEPPMVTSGLRLGTPAMTTRGFGEHEFIKIGHIIAEVLDSLTGGCKVKISSMREQVLNLTKQYPIYTQIIGS